ncbi:hypothetical protein AJ80_04882 [Polytolypa hystricis UAMH7299]|uniref:Major facilitator superfamily (MFS) profile domain-containing protein n=1 Tax=Polytolypa hystricis (strain UAMH7299) TaxID=1447883 RepID=A0A2B7Y7Q6_POLH7|nr:hypothetical protein AJ80_04882 [Polytolypa hystricis UAMH7299]
MAQNIDPEKGSPSTPDLEASRSPPDISQEDVAKDLTTSTDDFKSEEEPVYVEWDGPEDPQNPQNWPLAKRMAHVILAGATAFIANISSTAFAPAAELAGHEFNVDNETVAAFTVTIYLLGFALGPLVIAPLSEHYGRLIIYSTCLTVATAFLIGCSEANNVRAFLACRLITGIAGSGPGTIGGGTIADVMPKETRGRAMAVFAIGPLVGIGVGPLMGGFVAEYLGWRWIFRILYISTGTIFLLAVIFMRETYAPVLLQRKAARQRKNTGNKALRSRFDEKGGALRALWHAVQRPTKMLLFSPIVWSLSIYCAFVWGLLILLFTTLPAVYSGQYGFSPSISGLTYIGMGVGMGVGAVGFGLLSDRVMKSRFGDQPAEWKPEGRLLLMAWFSIVLPVGFFWYGWSAAYSAPWILPVLGTTFIGVGALFIMMPVQVYLVDSFGAATAASALAANTVLRSLAGTFLPLGGSRLYQHLGLGWGNSLLGFIAVGFCIMPALFFKYGEWMRKKWPINL